MTSAAPQPSKQPAPQSTMTSDIQEAAQILQDKMAGLAPEIAVILGSGLGAVADLLDEQGALPYTALPGFPQPGVEGHEGSLRYGHVEGVPALFLKGRVHLYEGTNTAPLKTMIRTLKAAGIKTLLLTNAAGSLRADCGPGSLMVVADHLNLLGTNPLAGPNDDEWGPRFPGMENAWDKDLRAQIKKQAAALDIDLPDSVFAGCLGPCFETPAEIRMFKALGADSVGMSMVAENIVANHCGLKCAGISAITNLAAGLSAEPLSHEQTLQGAKLAEEKMARLIKAFIGSYPK